MKILTILRPQAERNALPEVRVERAYAAQAPCVAIRIGDFSIKYTIKRWPNMQVGYDEQVGYSVLSIYEREKAQWRKNKILCELTLCDMQPQGEEPVGIWKSEAMGAKIQKALIRFLEENHIGFSATNAERYCVTTGMKQRLRTLSELVTNANGSIFMIRE